MLSSIERAKNRSVKNKIINTRAILKGKKLNINASAQRRYRNELVKITRSMNKIVNNEIKQFLKTKSVKEHFANDAGVYAEIDSVTKKLRIKFVKMFESVAPKMAGDMVDQIDKSSLYSLKNSVAGISNQLSINIGSTESGLGKLAQSIVAENIKLITSIPEQYMDDVRKRMVDSFSSASNTSDVLEKVVEAGDISDRRANIIALDQTRKAYGALNVTRMKNVGIAKAEWIHSGGSLHPRDSHIALDGTDFDLEVGAYDDDYGDYVLPGELVNCQCTMTPIIELDEGEEDDGSN